MSELHDTFQRVTLIVAFGGLAAILLGILLAASSKMLSELRTCFGASKIQGTLVLLMFVGAILYGGSKPTVKFDDGLHDNGTEITNDTVRVRWTYSGIPAASSVFIDYRESGSDGEWLNLGETLASALGWDGTLANATNYDYWVYSTYVPPIPVYTNGVWVGQTYETKSRIGAKAFLILNGRISEHGRTIAPPSAKRKENDNE